MSALLLHGRDLVRPFSPAKATAEWLRENEFADAPIVGTPGAPASAVAGYLDRQIYYPQTSGLGTFVRWDLYKQVGEDTEVEIMSGLLADGAPELILISEGPLRDPGGLAVSELVYFPAAEEQTEEYHVYRVTNR